MTAFRTLFFDDSELDVLETVLNKISRDIKEYELSSDERVQVEPFVKDIEALRRYMWNVRRQTYEPLETQKSRFELRDLTKSN